MSAYFPSSNKPDVKGLIQALAQDTADDTLSRAVTPPQWEALATYLQPFSIAESQALITQGSQDRTVYFIETGSLSVHYEDDAGRVRLAILGAGSAVGEGGFFSHLPRSATVQARYRSGSGHGSGWFGGEAYDRSTQAHCGDLIHLIHAFTSPDRRVFSG